MGPAPESASRRLGMKKLPPPRLPPLKMIQGKCPYCVDVVHSMMSENGISYVRGCWVDEVIMTKYVVKVL